MTEKEAEILAKQGIIDLEAARKVMTFEKSDVSAVQPYIRQHQVWSDFSRDILMNEHSSVQIEMYGEPVFNSLGSNAYIYALYTNPQSRKQGHARKLLEAAEQICRECGYDSVMLTYSEHDTPIEILHWYKRIGYEEVRRNPYGKIYLLKKLE
jgi:ribosomal protein S18 acetylase RimI-like enzyme